MAVRYLQSKVLVPLLHADSVVRSRLVDRLAGGDAGVWLISAPAGYGKTTLISQSLDGAGDVAWFSIDRADNDAVRFWTHVAAAVLGPGDELDELIEALDADRLDPTVDEILVAVEQRPTHVTLVLDDLHEIETEEILEALGRILSHLPPNLRVVISSRVDPALPIGRLRSHGQLTEIRAKDLAFTTEEAGAVFGRLDEATLDEAAIESIVDQTEGWATALRLLAVSIAGSVPTEDALTSLEQERGDLADFLSAEALSSLPPDHQRFLIRTSIVDELCPELADRLAEHSNSLQTLRDLARSQVFTDLVDPESHTYRYHRLFREFLRQRAQELDPDVLSGLHERAADWYAARESPTETIEHAMAAGNDQQALHAIKSYFTEYGQSGRMATANTWLETYGLERCFEDPQLRMIAAWVLLNIRRYDSVERWLEAPGGESPTASQRAQVHAIRSHRARHWGKLAEALSEAEQAVTHVLDPDPENLDWSFVFGALSMAQVIAGEPRADTANEAVSRGLPAENFSSMATGYSGLAAAAVLDGDLDDAESYADRALAFVTTPTLERFHQPVTALLVKAQVALARGHVGDAAAHAERAERIALAGVEPLFVVMARCELARVAHAQGRADEARQRLRDAETALGDCDAPRLEELVRQVRNESRFAPKDTALPVQLSERELAVLRLLPHGLSRKELGAQLFVSENTVKTHLTSLRHKLGVSGRSRDVVARAIELGLLDSSGSSNDG